jgi:hypothetical protein
MNRERVWLVSDSLVVQTVIALYPKLSCGILGSVAAAAGFDAQASASISAVLLQVYGKQSRTAGSLSKPSGTVWLGQEGSLWEFMHGVCNPRTAEMSKQRASGPQRERESVCVSVCVCAATAAGRVAEDFLQTTISPRLPNSAA